MSGVEAVPLEDVEDAIEAHVDDRRIRARLMRSVKRDVEELGQFTDEDLKRMREYHEDRTERLVRAAAEGAGK